MRKIIKSIHAVQLGLFVLITCQCKGQPIVQSAALDERNSIIVGETVTIKSQFTGMPLVEPHISAHPGNNNHLLAAAMVVTNVNNPYESCRLSSFVSQDGGLTWKETAHNWWDYDPWTAILANGQTAMSWIGTFGNFKDQYPIQFFSSADGGITWSDKVQTLPGGYDGTKIASSGNEFYFTTVRFRDNMGADVILCRREGESQFEEVAKIDGKGERLNFCEPAILTDGTVVVPASHFQAKAWVQVYDHKTRKLSGRYYVTAKAGGDRGYIRMASDATPNSPYRDKVYFVRAVGNGDTYSGIWLNHSSDKGKTWSQDMRIDLFKDSKASKAKVPSVAVNNRGILGISWVDSRHDPEQIKNDVYFAISKDGGKTFQRPARITSVSTDPRTPGNADVANKFPAGGHYLGLATKADGSFQLVWSDSRSGIFELQTCNVNIRN